MLNTELASIFYTNEGKESYQIDEIKVCNDPYCGCKTISLRISHQETNEKISVALDLRKKDVLLVDEKNEFTEFESHLSKSLDDSDWEILIKQEETLKAKHIEECRIETLDEFNPYFEERHFFESNLYAGFYEVFPGLEEFIYYDDENKQEFILVDFYCKNPSCNCSEVEFHMVRKNESEKSFVYDYSTSKLEDEIFRNVMQVLEDKYDSLNEKLKNRHSRLRRAYKNFSFTYEKYMKSKKENESRNKIGRNDPCPCGSGLKYKKCCLKKG